MTKDELFEIKSSYGHDLNAMARAIATLNDKYDESSGRIQELTDNRDRAVDQLSKARELLASKEAQILERGKLIEEDRVMREELHTALSKADSAIVKLKDDLQAKTSQLAETALLLADREMKHVDQLSRLHSDNLRLLTENRRLTSVARHMSALVAENTELSIRENQRVIWRALPALVTNKVKSLFIRHKEDALIDMN